jgi:hypothetical protein
MGAVQRSASALATRTERRGDLDRRSAGAAADLNDGGSRFCAIAR